VEQRVGYTNFTIDYGRPAARGREIMGKLITFGRLWRTGASQGTKIGFDRPVTISSKVIPAGTYAFVTIPDKQQWTVLLNSDTSKSYGDPSEYNTATEVLRFNVASEKTSRFVESLTIEFDIKNSNAILYLSWENTQIHFPIETGADEEALKRIDAAIKANPTNDEVLGEAAFYYTMNQKDLSKALDFVNKALAIKNDPWYHHQKIDIYISMKKYPEARKASEAAIEYFKRDKPREWELMVRGVEEKMKNFPK
jgi:tetratricopeptide (TPR) repeat protein